MELQTTTIGVVLLTATSLKTQETSEPGTTMPPGFATFTSVTCTFEAVEEVSQPSKTVTVRRGPDTAQYGWKGDDEPLYSWMEEGWPILPVWSAIVEPSGSITIQSWTMAGFTNMMTFRADGDALLSSHNSVNDPDQISWAAAVGRCEVTDGE